ncbi:flavodoxin family protein [bacterium]|jgi:multimeric flavodoxin WrbA|nr:flavodoxin family protein [bacterium]
MAKQVLIINGSYRDEGFTDLMLGIMKERLEKAGITVETVLLREAPIEFCLNCRNCTQAEGSTPGECSTDDGMRALIGKLEVADGYIFASPTNYGTVTALFKRFLERMTVFVYWPWGTPAPAYRKKESKAALCVSSCAAPSLLGRLEFNTLKVLKMAARNAGAKVVETLLIGLVSNEKEPDISTRDRKRIDRAVQKLIKALR